MIRLARHLLLAVVLLVPQTEGGRKPSFLDKSHLSFVFVRCTARPTVRRTDGDLALVIRLACNFVHVHCTARPTDRRTDGNLASEMRLACHSHGKPVSLDKSHSSFICVRSTVRPTDNRQIDGRKPSCRSNSPIVFFFSCTVLTTDRWKDGKLSSVISFTRHLSSFVVR